MEPIASPCIKVCVYNGRRGYCEGCYRSLDEIARWGTMDASQRQATLAACDARREAEGGELRGV